MERVLLALGLTPERAALSARLTSETDRDGVRTHGVARLPRFANWVREGRIDPVAKPECVAAFGAIERWVGHRGPGNLAAYAAMQRAMEIAATNGLGCVALADTSHWMRAGTFGWQAAEVGFAAMCWTNTLPKAIEASQRALPIGFWKGSGLSFVLDVLAAMLTGGLATNELPRDPAKEVGQSQVFLAIAPQSLAPQSLAAMEELSAIAQRAIDAVHAAEPIEAGKPARYPGEATLRTRAESLVLGVAVEDAAWEQFVELEREVSR